MEKNGSGIFWFLVMGVDPLSVLDMLFVNVTNTCSHYPLKPPICTPHPLHDPFPLPSPSNNTPSVSLTNPASYPICGWSEQEARRTALYWPSHYGTTETMLALLAAPGIDVNHADVSIYPLTPSHIVVERWGWGGLPPLPPHSNPRTNVLSSPNLENVPHH